MLDKLPFNMIDVIRKKRDDFPLSHDDIQGFVSAYTEERIPDYQAASLLMAIFLRGLSDEELFSLTHAMLYSGAQMDLSSIRGPKIGKHSTGGVGDKLSIHLVPAVAACGVYVPKLSGRGLGHTGGTLDKLDSIPGFNTQIPIETFTEVLKTSGFSITGASQDLVPADKKIYALRDVTGTVESIPLIAASIMSKKLAEGLDGMVLDVKVGSGALMKTLADSKKLASALLALGKSAGKQISAFITTMDQPLGRWIGNAVEINESIEILRGKGPQDLSLLTRELGGEMLRLGGVVKDRAEGAARIEEVLQNGQALQCLAQSTKLQGATIDLAEEGEVWFQKNHYKHRHAIFAEQSGYVTKIEALEVGLSGVALGIGRMKKKDAIDPKAFIYLDKKCGEFVHKGEALCHFAAAEDLAEDRLIEAQTRLRGAYSVDKVAPQANPLIVEVFS